MPRGIHSPPSATFRTNQQVGPPDQQVRTQGRLGGWRSRSSLAPSRHRPPRRPRSAASLKPFPLERKALMHLGSVLI